MKCLRSHRSFLGFFMFALTLSWQITPPLMGATVYWDVDGNVAGAGGASPTGTWDGTNTFWNSLADGTGSTTAWATGNTAVFAAGSNATGAYAVTVAGTQSIGGLRFEEGTVTLSGGTLSLAGPSDIWVDAGQTATINSALAAGPASGTTVTKSGAGTLVLGGSNVAGNLSMVVNAGAVSVGTTSHMVSGRLTLNGGALQVSESMTTGNVLALGMAGGTFDIAGTKVLTAGSTAITGGGSLTKTGAGTLTLAVASTYGGATTVSQGFLSAASFIPARSAVTVAAGATIDFLNAAGTIGSLSGAGTVALSTTTTTTRILTIGGDNTSTTFSGLLTSGSNRMAITKVGAGTLTLQLAAATTYNQPTIINAGTLALDFSQGALNSMLGSTATTLSGGTLQIIGRSGSSTVSQTLNGLTVGAGGGRIVMTPNGATATNLTTGTLTATAAGGTLLVQAPTGTTVKLGTALDTAINSRLVFTNGTAGSFDWAANTGSASNTIAFAGYVPLDLTAGTDTGNSTLTGSALLTGARNTGTLKVMSSGAGQSLDLATQTLALNGGGLLYTGADNYTISNGSLQSNNAELIVQQHGAGSLTIGAVIKDGTAGLTVLSKAGSGNLVLTGTNTFTGGVFVNEGTLTVSNPAQLGANAASTAITIRDGATFATTADMTVLGGAVTGAHTFVLSGGNARFDVAPSTTLTLSGVASGAGGMTLTNTGMLVLGAAATFTGPAIVGAGATLKGGVTAFINAATGGGLTVAAGGLVDMNDFTLTVGGISGAGTITNSSATLRALTVGGNHVSTTFSGLLSGNVSLTKNGGGTLTLSGVNTQTGVLTVAGGGTITVAGAGTFGASSIPVTLTAGVLDLNGTSQSVGMLSGVAAGSVRSAGSAAAVTFSMGNGSAVGATSSFAGTIENGDGVVSVVKNGAGAVTLGGINTYTGGTQVNEGTLVYGSKASQPAAGTTTVAAGAGFGLGVGGSGFFSEADVQSLYANTFAGVSLAPTSNIAIDTSAGDFEMTGTFGMSPRGLVKTGANTLTLNGTNAHSGGTAVLGGTLAITSVSNLGGSSNTLTMGAGTTLRFVPAASTANLTNPITTLGAVTFDVADASSSLRLASNFAPGAVVKTGLGTLRLSGDISSSSTLTVGAGTLRLDGAYTATGLTTVANAVGKAILNVPSGGSLSGGTITLGTVAESYGALNISGGTVTMATGETTDTVSFGAGNGGYGAFTMSSGTFTQQRFMFGGNNASTGAGGIGVGLVTGGTVNTAGYIILARAGASTGVLTITGGTINHTAASQHLNIMYAGSGRGELNVAGGLIDNTGRNVVFGAGTATGSGVANLNAGVLMTNTITDTSGTSTVNFNGGTLRAAVATGTFVATNIDNAFVNGAFGTFNGGAVIDSNGFAITIPRALTAPTGNGVRTLALTNAGSGYVGAPYVQITGDGTGATGYAVVDTDPLSPTVGQVTSIVITNPGVNYTTAPTITLVGGGGTGAAATGAIGANTSGGLTKVGVGTLTLTGASTYTGATVVNGGTLSIMPSAIAETSGVHVGQTGSGTLDLFADGVGAAWNLASGAGLTLGSATSTGTLGFQLGAVGASDTIVLNGGALTINAGGGRIDAVALSGFGAGSYSLISGAGSITGASSLQLGTMPGGYFYTLTPGTNNVTLNVAAAPGGNLYWTGSVNSAWGGLNGTTSNWATDASGAVNAGYSPAAGNVVYFSATNAGSAPINTTLDLATSIQGLRILNSGTGAVTIAPGTGGTLTVGADGISVLTGAPATTLISAPVTLGVAQTWNVADAGSTLTVTGAVSGGVGNSTQAAPGSNISLTITGAGVVSLGSSANTFTGDILVNGGTYAVDNADRDWGGPTVANTTSKTIFLQNGGKVSVSGSVNPGSVTTTNYNLVQIGAGGGTIETVSGAVFTLDDAGQFSGTGALTKTGVGTLVLRNQQAFAGAITIAAGVLQASTSSGGVGIFGTNTVGTTIASGAAFNVNGQAVTDTETLTINGTGLASAPTGVITNSSGTAGSFAGPVVLGSDSTVGAAAAGGLTLSGGITGAFNLNIANLAAGGTTLSTGTVNNAGTITNSGTGAGTTTISAVIGTNVGNVIQNSSTSQLTLGGVANLWTGGLVIKAGTVLGGANANTFGANTNVITLGDTSGSANATLVAASSQTYQQAINVAGGNTGVATITAGNSTGSVVFSGLVTLGGHDVVLGKTGTTGASQFTGGFGGTGNITINNTATTGTLSLNAALVNHTGAITHTSTATGTTTIGAIIGANVTGVTQMSTTSTLLLSGANAAFAGGVTVKQGILQTQLTATALGTAPLVLGDTVANSNNVTWIANFGGTTANAIVLASGTTGTITITSPNTGTLQVISGSITGTNNLVVAGTAAMGISFSGSINHTGTLTANGTGAGAVVISGVIGTNVTSVTQTGTSQLTLSGNNLYTGLTTVNSGTTVSIGSGSTAGSILGNVFNNGTLIFNRSNAYTYAGDISGSGAVTKSAAGTVILSGTNTYTGITTINGGALAGNISANNLVLNGGVYEASGSFTRSLGTGAGQVQWAAAANGGFSAQGGALTVTLAGAPATLVWDGTTNFVSGAGQLLFGSLTADNAVTFTHNIDLNGAARTVQVVDNTGSTADKAVLSGVLSNGSLTKTGTGVLELTGASTYTGSTLVSAGTLSVASIGGTGVASSNLGAGNATISIGSGTTTAGTLIYTGAGETTDRALNLAGTTTAAATLNSSGTGALTWQGNVTSAGTTKIFTLGGDYTGSANVFSGSINLGTGSLAKAGAGTWELTAANTFVNTTVSAGTLKLSGAGTLGSGTLTMGGVAGATTTLEIGAGVSIPPTSITYTGTTGGAATITGAGTLNLGTAGYTVTVADNTANAVDMYWSMNTLTGSGTLVKAGAGTLDISGIANNNFTGSIQVSAGAVMGQAAGANLILNGGVYEGSGTFTRSLGTTGNTVQWAAGANGGFSANGGALTVTINNSATPALVWDSTPQFVSGAGALLFGSLTANNVVTFTNNIDLNNAVRTVQVVDNTGSTADKAVLSGVLSNGGMTKTGNGILRLEGESTFTGALTITQGTLEFATVTNNGVAGSLGQGTNNIVLNGGTLSFAGSTSQSTDRGISSTASSTLAANGTGGATITYTGAITPGIDFNLTLSGTGAGIITGGIVQPAGAASADLTVTGGDWTLSGTNSSIADDLFVNAGTLTLTNTVVSVNDDTIVTGGTAVLNLNSTGVWKATTPSGTSSGLYARTGGTINLNADNINGVANANGLDYFILGDSGPGAAGVLNVNTFNTTVSRLDVGNTGDDLLANVLGTGTLTVTSTATDYTSGIRLLRGSVAANLAGVAALLKQGLGEVTLSGNNSGLTGTVAATNVDAGTLILDYSTDNNTKLSSTAALSMRGGTLALRGGVLAATVQNVVSTTLTNGASVIQAGSTGAFATTLNLGAITRAISTGTVRFAPGTSGSITTTTANAASGVLGNVGNTGTAYALFQDGSGTYFATNDGTGKIVALTYAGARNNVAAWAAGDNVTNDAAFTGTASTVGIGSLRFNAPVASTVNIAPAATLTIASGGILQTSNVTGGPSVISGGRLVSGSGELVVTTDSASSVFRISSYISGTTALTKAGAGTLLLNTKNHYSGGTVIQEGILQVSGGNAIGDRSTVTLGDDHDIRLVLLDDEVIGPLSGGNNLAGMSDLAVVDISTHRLTINSVASSTYNGQLSGSGTLVKTGASTLTLGGAMDFSGALIINQGQVTLDNFNYSNLNLVGSVTLNGGTIYADYTGGTTSSNKIRDGAAITLANTGGINGLYAANDRTDASRNESVGATTLLAGANTITAHHTSTGTTGTQRNMSITLGSLTRANRSTLLVHGLNLGTLDGITTGHTGRVIVTGGLASSLLGGGSTTAGTTNWSIVPWAVGSATLAGLGDSFVTYGTNGFRPLNLTTEYEALSAATGITLGNNVRYSGSADLTLDGTAKTLNALLVENTSTTAGITLSGAGGSLNVASGAFLFTGSATPQGITLSGFSGITTSLSTEYVLHVVNASAAGVTINAPFTTAGAGLTKSGAGTLILGATGSTYTGITTVNQGVLQIDSLNKLGNGGSGGLMLNGGTLRFGAAFDLSDITVTLGVTTASATVETTAGGTLDTGSLGIVLAKSIGNGGNGGLTKTGTGSLTLNAVANYGGGTTISAGSVVYGVNNALPTTTNLTLAASTTLDVGTHAATLGGLTLTGAATLAGNGAVVFNGEFINSGNNTLTISNDSSTTFNGEYLFLAEAATARTLTLAITGAGVTTINGIITDGGAPASALTKTGNGVLILNGASYYTGTTSISAGSVGIGHDMAFGTGALTLGAATLYSTTADRTISGITTLSLSSGLTSVFSGDYSLTLSADNIYYGNSSTTTGVLTNNLAAGKTLTLNATGVLRNNRSDANRTLTINGSGRTVVNAEISDFPGTTVRLTSINYTGSGMLEFWKLNSYTGATTVNSIDGMGTLKVLAGSNISNAALTVTSGTLDLLNGAQSITTLTMGNGPVGSTSSIKLNTGALSLGGDVTYTASATSGTATISGGTVNLLADRTFTINDSTATTQEMLVDATLANGDGTARGIIKAGTGTLVLNQANTYTGTTSINAGTLKFSVAQNMTGGLQFGSTSAITTAGTLDLSDVSAVFPTLLVQTNSATAVNNLIVGSGRSLTINGNVNIGSTGASTTTLFTATGGGSLIVNNTAPSGVFQVGGALAGTSNGNRALADLSGLSELSVTLNSTNGVFRVNPTSGSNQSGRYSTLILPSTGLGKTTVTANLLAIGDGLQNNGADVNALLLGSGENVFNVNTINIGTGTRDSGSLTFNGATGSLVVRNAAGTGRAAFNLGTTGGGTGAAGVNTFDVRGHNADLLLGAVSMGTQNRLNTYTNTFSFDQGTLDMTSLTMSARTTGHLSTGSGQPRDIISTMNLGGGTVVFQNGILSMASVSGTYDTATNLAPVVTANLNISGGNVTIGVVGTVGTNAITMATASASSDIGVPQAVANINLTGGTTTVNGNIVRGNVSGNSTATATVTLNGGTLNMTGKSVGGATNTVNLDAQQGTLRNLGQLNGGGTLTKTTAGLLVVEGTNTYTGTTQVNGGIVQVGSAGAGSIASGPVNVASGATLAGSGTIGGATVISSGAVLQPGDVTTVGTATSTITGNHMLTFTAANTALTVDTGAQIRLGVSSPTQASSVAFSGGQFQYNGNSYSTAAALFSSEPGALAAWNVNPTAATNHDMIKLVNGTLSIGDRAGGTWGEGSVLVNGVLGSVQAGQVFNLIDWNGVSIIGGTFDTGGSAVYDATNNVIAGDLDLIALGAGYGWDVSAFAQYGIIVVVPEPSRVLFLLLGLSGLMLRRRRR